MGAGLDRRGFLAGSAVAAAAAVAGCTTRQGERAGQPTATPAGAAAETPASALEDWDGVRAEFALDPGLAHFAAWTLAAHPAPVRDAIERFRTALDRDTPAVMSGDQANEQAVREAAGRYLGVEPIDVALTDSTTMGLGLAAAGLRLPPGSHVLTTTHDFYSLHEALRLGAGRAGAQGAEVEKVPLYDQPADATAGEMVSRLRAAVRDTTRVVAVTWVHSSTGVKTPVGEIAAMLAEANAGRAPGDQCLLLVDGVHGLGVEDNGPAALGCDVFVAGTHKWLFGPRGTGVLWARPEIGSMLVPTVPSFSAPEFGNWLTGATAPGVFGLSSTPGGYHSFEHRWALAAAFDFHRSIGIARVAERTRAQAARLKDGLAALPRVRLVTPHDPAVSAGIVCCEIAGEDPADVAARLRRDHGIVVSVTPYRERYLRIGPSIVTTPEQVDDLVAALA